MVPKASPAASKTGRSCDANPYAVLEGGLIAAHAVGALEVIVAMKRTSTDAASRIDAAIGELEAAGWCDGVKIEIFEGPPEYLFGEETALLETIDGRFPFPRIAPPFRRGVDEIVDCPADVASGELLRGACGVRRRSWRPRSRRRPWSRTSRPSRTSPGILAEGAEWFRSIGTRRVTGDLGVHRLGSDANRGRRQRSRWVRRSVR